MGANFMKLLQRLVNPVRGLFKSWHSIDRIRITPSEGRLLRLAVGDRFLLFDSLYSVDQRRVESFGDGYNVVYSLSNSAGDFARLSIDTTESQTSTGRLVNSHSDVFVFDTDVTVLHNDCDQVHG